MDSLQFHFSHSANHSNQVRICDTLILSFINLTFFSDSDDDNLSAILIAGKVYSKTQYIEEVEEAKLIAKKLLTEINTWKLLHRLIT